MTDLRPEAANGLLVPLTDREREILACLVGGLSNGEIAARLHLALRTIKWYNSQIYSKLGVRNRREAIEWARLFESSLNGVFTPARHNLPPQATRFVGRQRELGEISALLADPDVRLLTLLAPGGMGKTRLALEAARAQIGSFTDGVFFVPLAPLSSTADLITTIAESISFSFYGENTPIRQLVDFLRDRSLLLVLDNFEHLLDGAPFVAEMVRSAPGLRVLATSREQLNLRAETVYALRGLEFSTEATSESVRDYDAVKLFAQAAQRVHPGFTLQGGELSDLARIFRLTAGMPLAIELAAGWVDILSLERIGHEIQAGIDILQADLRDLPERHRSVRATFEHTWNRLSAHEQAIFARLSVFRGGFTLPAAQAIGGANAHQLRKLAQKTLIQTEGSERFAIHELLRQFGADRLNESGEATALQTAHAAYFADFMAAHQGSFSSAMLDQVGADFENVRSAFYTLVEQQAFDQLPHFVDGLQFFLNVRNRWQEGVELFESAASRVQALPPSDATGLTLGRLWARLSWFYAYSGLPDKGQDTAEAATRLLSRYDSTDDLLFAYRNVALIAMLRGDGETQRQMAEVGCELARQLGKRSHEAHSLIQFSLAAVRLNDDPAVALRSARQARAIFAELGDTWGMLISYNAEAGSAFQTGDYEQAKHLLIAAQPAANIFGSAHYVASNALYLGIVALRQGDDRQAWELLRRSLRIFWEAGYTHFAPVPLLRMAELMRRSDTEHAVEILALTDRYPRYPTHGALFEMDARQIEALRRGKLEAQSGSEGFAAAYAQGQKRDLSAMVAALLADS